MVRLRYVALLALAACQFDTNTQGELTDDGGQSLFDAAVGSIDAGEFDPDASLVDAVPVLNCEDWNPQPTILDPCKDIEVSEVDDSLLLDETGGVYLYDTDLGTLTSPAMADVPHTSVILGNGGLAPRVVVARTIDIEVMVTLRATGARPLILVSWENFSISGVIDVGSSATEIGAGANDTDCDSAEPGEDDNDGGGGGGGGGFGGDGGDGADARDGSDAAGGNGGQAVTAPSFRGGCAGGDGGDGESDIGGIGGNSGGAVYLLARETLTISGSVTSGGQGGTGSQGDRSGGAGGGSGGMIGMEAANITLVSGAIIAANGGGGGGGTNQATADPGQAGQASAVAALGGAGEASPAGDGGNGSAGASSVGLIGTTSNRGGGGGGGGAGVIFEVSNSFQAAGAVISPALTP